MYWWHSVYLYCCATIIIIHLQTLFILENWNSVSIKKNSTLTPSPRLPVSIILLSLSMNLVNLSTSYKWNHVLFLYFCDHLNLLSVTTFRFFFLTFSLFDSHWQFIQKKVLATPFIINCFIHVVVYVKFPF